MEYNSIRMIIRDYRKKECLAAVDMNKVVDYALSERRILPIRDDLRKELAVKFAMADQLEDHVFMIVAEFVLSDCSVEDMLLP